MTTLAVRVPTLGAAVHYCDRERRCFHSTVAAVDRNGPDMVDLSVDDTEPGWAVAADVRFCAVLCPNSWHWADRCPSLPGAKPNAHLGATGE